MLNSLHTEKREKEQVPVRGPHKRKFDMLINHIFFKIFQMSHEVPHFGRDHKMSYEKLSEYKNRVTLCFPHKGQARKMNTYLPQSLIRRTDLPIKFFRLCHFAAQCLSCTFKNEIMSNNQSQFLMLRILIRQLCILRLCQLAAQNLSLQSKHENEQVPAQKTSTFDHLRYSTRFSDGVEKCKLGRGKQN